MTHVLVARLDNEGDVLLAGPAVRAVAATADRVTLWCGPRGRRAAGLLPGVDDVIEHLAEWIDPAPPAVDRAGTDAFVTDLSARNIDTAVIFTSFHQSPLPAALLLRLAGVPTVGAISDDYPGALLDVRHRVDANIHEVERSLSLAAAMGYRLPAGDHGRLAIRSREHSIRLEPGYVVVHPGASVSARTWAEARWTELVDALLASGWRVAVTGSPAEVSLASRVGGGAESMVGGGAKSKVGGGAKSKVGGMRPGVQVLAGRTTFAELADVLAGAAAVIVGNTGPAHLAAAVGTPVVSLFAPTVPAVRWRPWAVPHVLLGHQDIACAGCRASTCPVVGHPCLDIATDQVIDALRRVLANPDETREPLAPHTARARHIRSATDDGEVAM